MNWRGRTETSLKFLLLTRLIKTCCEKYKLHVSNPKKYFYIFLTCSKNSKICRCHSWSIFSNSNSMKNAIFLERRHEHCKDVQFKKSEDDWYDNVQKSDTIKKWNNNFRFLKTDVQVVMPYKMQKLSNDGFKNSSWSAWTVLDKHLGENHPLWIG